MEYTTLPLHCIGCCGGSRHNPPDGYGPGHRGKTKAQNRQLRILVKSGVFRVTALDGSDLVLIAPEHWLASCKKTDEEVASALLLVLLNGVIMQPQILLIYSNVIWKVILGNSFKPEVVGIFVTYSATLISVMKALKAQRPLLARISAAFSKDVRQANAQLKQASALFAPLFEQCVQASEQGLARSSLDPEWLLAYYQINPEERETERYYRDVHYGQYVCASPSRASTPEFDNSRRLF
ncbi:cytochrome P450 [Colletotrichum cuscutae]|uniref:Cytochrome P450 n=1 Tax=Colletotrichum cuscutae TaxID=1209917 RepID=A0AAI9VCS4_9PEZI|nr:cytochrome P450 [Colletotrichum cuscutae]